MREGDASDADGKKLRPDCVVNLPLNRHLVVDAKCPLTAYAEACAASGEDGRREALARHVKSVRAHVKELAAKRYGELACFNAPGFVFMFVPIDGALSAALDAAPSLYDEAQRQGVYLVFPSTLLPALRAVSSLRILTRQNERVQAIAAVAGKVYDRLESVLGALADVDRKRQALTASFDTLAGRLHGKSRSLSAMLQAFSAKASLDEVKATPAGAEAMPAEAPAVGQASPDARTQALRHSGQPASVPPDAGRPAPVPASAGRAGQSQPAHAVQAVQTACTAQGAPASLRHDPPRPLLQEDGFFPVFDERGESFPSSQRDRQRAPSEANADSRCALPEEGRENFWQTFPKAGNR